MEKLNKIRSNFTVLPIENIDTDQIIPAVHLKSIDRLNFGAHLFSSWRAAGKLKLDQWPIEGAPNMILLAGPNFGCGSSREHAVWALYDYGFRVILSVKIADIFNLNALNNGLLTIEIEQEIYDYLVAHPFEDVIVNLEEQFVEIPKLSRRVEFSISPFKKKCLMNGYDTIDYLLDLGSDIEAFETNKKEVALNC